MNLKRNLKQLCLARLNEKITAFQNIITDLSLDAQNDAKSSAGDKHETSLSMMHLEQENLSKKINENIALRDVILRVDETKISNKVEFGSVVKLNSVNLFLSAALPKITYQDESILAISMDAPIAKELIGKELNDTFVFNNCEFTVNSLR